jgi:hypothetical protein
MLPMLDLQPDGSVAMRLTLIPLALMAAMLTGCVDPNDPAHRAAAGGAMGLGTGAALGGALGGRDGALLGGMAGAAAGAAAGVATTPQYRKQFLGE